MRSFPRMETSASSSLAIQAERTGPPGSHEPDAVADMVRRARADPRAFGEIYDAFFARIYGYVATRVRTRADAEDVVSDTFMRALDKLPQFEYRGPASFAAWIFRIARNRIIDEQTSQARHANIDLLEVRDRARAEDAPDVGLEREEEAHLLRVLIDSLPPRRQEVIALRFFGGLRNREIAEVMGLDQRTVASHLCRALEQLRDQFERATKAAGGS